MSAYSLSIDQLASLFEPDHIRDGTSIANLKQWGKIEKLQSLLRTSYKKGIAKDLADHQGRINAYGDNQPIVKKPKTILQLIIENFQDQMLRVLCFAAVISLVLGILTQGLAQGWLQGASILVAVVIIVSVTSGNNYVKQKQFQKLNAIATAKNVDVYRGGDLVNISVYELLVGDVVQISTGEIFSVDGILIEGSDISVDQSSLTGQTNQIKKKVPITYEKGQGASPFLISSSKLMSGTGLMLVAAVGRNSYYGKLKMKIQQDQDDTPLQIKLTDLADQVGQVGMVAAAATFSAMLIHYIYDCIVAGFVASFFTSQTLHELVEYFIIAVSIVVVAVPQGLPLSVTIALAYSVGKMKDQNNLVRYLQACQTMGGADNICSDKTGTLTKNQMTVTQVFIQQKISDTVTNKIMTQNTCKLFSLGICNNSNANPRFTNDKGVIKAQQIGNKTQCALIEAALKMGYDYEKWRNRDKIKKTFPFSSQKKKMATVYEDEKGKMYLFVKGAPDYLLQYCTSYINKEGGVSKIAGGNFLNSVNQSIEAFANATLRTLLLTYKQVQKVPQNWDQIQKELTIIGMVGIKDPLKQGIAEAVTRCNEGGVIVRMITGDNKNTAIAIAKQAGILPQNWKPSKNDYTVMQGKQFRQFVGGLVKEGTQQQPIERVGNLQNFKLIRDQLKVLARSSPDDKYLITTGLKQLDHVVAMTGDGTNDAPALKKADIGFAMGIAGTQVAKEASGIILLDDNFCSIVTAMKWGRNIFDSIRKFLQFQLTVNFVALVMAFVGGAILRESPLNPIQMLWVNLIMDTLASLALATEPPSDQLLKRKPYSKRESLITRQMWKFIISQGICQIIILGTILFKGPQIFGIPSSIGVKQWNNETGKHYSIFFNVFVLLQVFNQINARKLKNHEKNVFEHFFNNKLFIIIVVFTIFIQLLMVKYGGKSMKTVELSTMENIQCILLGATSLVSCLLFKIILPENMWICKNGIEIGSFKYYWKKVQLQEQKED